MQVKICDEQKCGRIIEGEQVNIFTLKTEEGITEITLIGDTDRCAECSRKIFARLAAGAWDQLKQKREKKKEKNNG